MGSLYGLDEEDPDPIINEESPQRAVETGSLRPDGPDADTRWVQAQECAGGNPRFGAFVHAGT